MRRSPGLFSLGHFTESPVGMLPPADADNVPEVDHCGDGVCRRLSRDLADIAVLVVRQQGILAIPSPNGLESSAARAPRPVPVQRAGPRLPRGGVATGATPGITGWRLDRDRFADPSVTVRPGGRPGASHPN